VSTGEIPLLNEASQRDTFAVGSKRGNFLSERGAFQQFENVGASVEDRCLLRANVQFQPSDRVEVSSTEEQMHRNVRDQMCANDRVVQWAHSLCLPELLASYIQVSKADSALNQISKLHHNPSAVDAILKTFVTRLRSEIISSSEALQRALKVKAEQEEKSKFTIDSMQCGDIQDFHDGILKRIGQYCNEF
jgi:hypothetical protein